MVGKLVRCLGTLGFALLAVSAGAQPARTASTPRPVRVVGDFQGDNGAATNLSGVARAPESDGVRLCLLVDDQGSAAQWARLAAGTLTVGGTVDLVAPASVGATTTTCPGGVAEEAKQDVDGEAVAYSAPYFYVIGSHGCSRKKGRYSPQSFRLYRVEPGASRAAASTDRVALEMKASPELGRFVQWALDERANGASVEGLAFSGDEVLVGLRSPSLNGSASIMALKAAAAFGAQPASTRVIAVPVGPSVGIRDLAPLPDGRLIVLAGPAQSQTGTFSMHVLGLRGDVSPIAGWGRPANGGVKAEAVVVLGASATEAELLLVYEGVPNGAPEIVRVALPPATAPQAGQRAR